MSFIGVQMANKKSFGGEGDQKGVVIQAPSTAAFMIDSANREDSDPNASSGKFVISKAASLFNGFFNRIAVQEVVLDWGIPNVFEVDIGGGETVDCSTFTITYVIAPAAPVQLSIQLPTGFYTVEQALDLIVDELNTTIGTPGLFTVGATAPDPRVLLSITGAGNTFEINATNLSQELFAENQLDDGQHVSYQLVCPRLLPYRYIDIACPSLTYNQDLKDNDTSPYNHDVLYRWYFAWDTPTAVDGYGFPILQGYTPFIQRRIIPFPKQILWNRNQPIGQLAFEVQDESGVIVNADAFSEIYGGAEMEFQMTLLLSEN